MRLVLSSLREASYCARPAMWGGKEASRVPLDAAWESRSVTRGTMVLRAAVPHRAASSLPRNSDRAVPMALASKERAIWKPRGVAAARARLPGATTSVDMRRVKPVTSTALDGMPRAVATALA